MGVNLATSTTYTSLKNDDISTVTGAQSALTGVTTAISQLASDRATIGTNIETLTNYSNQLSTLNNNLSAANSQIMDVDVAQESTPMPNTTSSCKAARQCWHRRILCRNRAEASQLSLNLVAAGGHTRTASKSRPGLTAKGPIDPEGAKVVHTQSA